MTPRGDPVTPAGARLDPGSALRAVRDDYAGSALRAVRDDYTGSALRAVRDDYAGSALRAVRDDVWGKMGTVRMTSG